MANAAPSLACPHRSVLQQFLQEELSETDASHVGAHVDSCASCQAALAELVGDLPGTLGRVVPRVSAAVSGDLADEGPVPELAGFRAVKRIASGGMGVVWRMHDQKLDRDLAVKVMTPSAARHPALVQRFYQEARLCARLAHPFIVPIHDMGQLADGRPYYTMKLVQGETLAARLRRRQDAAQDRMELIQIFGRVCQAMAFAHRRSIIHRDLKPQNIMLGEHGEVQLMDWGLAKSVGEPQPASRADHQLLNFARDLDVAVAHSDDMTMPWEAPQFTADSSKGFRERARGKIDFATGVGDILGTVAYMPPEQARGEIDEVDRRSDVFALGAILFEILDGARLYPGANLHEVRQRAQRGDVHQALARLQARYAGRDGPELAAILGGRIRLHVIHVDMARAAPQADHDHRFLGAAGWLLSHGICAQQPWQSKCACAQTTKTEKTPPR